MVAAYCCCSQAQGLINHQDGAEEGHVLDVARATKKLWGSSN